MIVNPSNIVNILLFMIPWAYLIFEITVNDYATYLVTAEEIILSKPLRKYSLFSRKRNQLVCIKPEDWNSLYYKKINGRQGSSVMLYFRKDKNIAYFFSTSGLQKSVDEIQQVFPDKHFVHYGDLYPRKLIKQLRKEFPERVV